MKSDSVQTYWEQHAEAFDALYCDQSSAVERLFNRVARRSVFERLALAVREVRAIPGARVLDVGCGSGRGSIAFARAGAREVVGVDFSRPMIQMARDSADRGGVRERCTFLQQDFLTADLSGEFDVVAVLGVLDYVAEPDRMLQKVKSLTRCTAIVSAPKPVPVRSQLRRRRYARQGCPVFFYTNESLAAHMRSAGFTTTTIHDHGAASTAVARLP